MTSIFIASIIKSVNLVVKSISLITKSPLHLSLFLLAGLTFEEIYYGLRIIKYLGII